MSNATAVPNGLLHVPAGAKLLGEIITWSCSGSVVRHYDLVEALRTAELDESVARELAPRHAFTRACRKLSDARIIRQVGEDEASVYFQFTAEQREGDRFAYELEAILTLDKSTGRVHCDQAALARLAQDELDRCIAARTGADITRVVQKLCEQHADLFPIRPQGGAYFVPQEHSRFVDRLQTLLGQLNGRMLRYPVPAGTPQGDRSVQEAVRTGIATLIAEHRAAIAEFDAETRDGTLERAAERIRKVRHKLSAYSAYLADERERLERDLLDAARELRAKVEQIGSSRECEAASAG